LALFDAPKDRRMAEVKGQRVVLTLSKAEGALTDAFPRLERGYDYPFASAASWSLHDLDRHLIGFIGPAALWATTWSFTQRAADKLIAWRTEGLITQIRLLVDWSVQVQHPGLIAVGKTYLDRIAIENIHAKTFVLRNESWAVSYTGSANFTTNPRIECGYLSTNPAVAEFHQRWIDAAIEGGKPFGIQRDISRQNDAEAMFEEGAGDE
jgi:hypothetical protein